jgi:hypothetical protein
MDAAAFIVLALALLAILVRSIAAAPLFTTLSICFGNWADESRSGGSP